MMKLTSTVVRFALCVTLFGAGLTMYFLSDDNWLLALTRIVFCLSLLLFGWWILSIFVAMERTRKIAHVLRNYDLHEPLTVNGGRVATSQRGNDPDPDRSKIQKGAPPLGR